MAQLKIFQKVVDSFHQNATIQLNIVDSWLLLRIINKSGEGQFWASFVRSQLWIVRDLQPIRIIESKIARAGELCHGGFAYGSIGLIFREN